jgi:Domain of unknown function (DUF222)/HNH endonuclease
MPVTAEALSGGAISIGAAAMLCAARETDVEAFARCEAALVDAAMRLSVPDLMHAIERFRALADTDAIEAEARRRFARRRLYASAILDGMIRIDGDLDPETGQVVITALSSVVDAWARSEDRDERSPAQRRADALGEICRQYLDGVDRPVVGGERPHVTVTVDLATLESMAGTGELDDAGSVTGEAARRIACDARVSRVITRGRSEPLDVGRQTRVVSAALRRAVVIRDRACRFPGCELPHRWCDAHHVEHWVDGGSTSLSNLVLLCRRHHRSVHDGFRVRFADGDVRFTAPDGRPIERHPP